MKRFYPILLLSCLALHTRAQYNDPNFAKPASGYGSDGSHTIGVVSFANPAYPAKDIEIYHPSDIATPVPTIFYSHAYGGNISANIIGMLNFVAMKGYAIVFVPYQTTGVTVSDRYNNLLNGFRKAARDYPDIIDTGRVGFMGHSFGGGASFANAYQSFTETHWGLNGRFIYTLAQWYSYNISQTQLQSFPSDVKLLTEIFDDDVTNDHRMAMDMFNNINISAAEKDFLLLKSDTLNGYIYVADHVVPNTASAFNAFDYYAYYRLLDALCDYTFNGNLAGKDVALGNGSPAQVTMPTGLKNLVQTDNPSPVYPESKYEFPCSDSVNLRAAYCPATLGVDAYTISEVPLSLYPNPANAGLTVRLPTDTPGKEQLKLYGPQGQLLLTRQTYNQSTFTLDVSLLPSGIYFVTFGGWKAKLVIEK